MKKWATSSPNELEEQQVRSQVFALVSKRKLMRVAGTIATKTLNRFSRHWDEELVIDHLRHYGVIDTFREERGPNGEPRWTILGTLDAHFSENDVAKMKRRMRADLVNAALDVRTSQLAPPGT